MRKDQRGTPVTWPVSKGAGDGGDRSPPHNHSPPHTRDTQTTRNACARPGPHSPSHSRCFLHLGCSPTSSPGQLLLILQDPSSKKPSPTSFPSMWMLLLHHRLFGISQTWVPIQALLLLSCVMLDKLLPLSGLYFPHLEHGSTNTFLGV